MGILLKVQKLTKCINVHEIGKDLNLCKISSYMKIAYRALVVREEYPKTSAYRALTCLWKVAAKGKKLIFLLKDRLASLLTQWLHLNFPQTKC